jgi:hypothetical protein
MSVYSMFEQQKKEFHGLCLRDVHVWSAAPADCPFTRAPTARRLPVRCLQDAGSTSLLAAQAMEWRDPSFLSSVDQPTHRYQCGGF